MPINYPSIWETEIWGLLGIRGQRKTILNRLREDGKMAQWIQISNSKPGDLNSTPGIHTVETRNGWTPSSCPLSPPHTHTCVPWDSALENTQVNIMKWKRKKKARYIHTYIGIDNWPTTHLLRARICEIITLFPTLPLKFPNEITICAVFEFGYIWCVSMYECTTFYAKV